MAQSPADGDELLEVRFVKGAIVGHVDLDGHDAALLVDAPDVVDHPLVRAAGSVGLGPARAQVGENVPLETVRGGVRFGGRAEFRLFARGVVLLVRQFVEGMPDLGTGIERDEAIRIACPDGGGPRVPVVRLGRPVPAGSIVRPSNHQPETFLP